MWIKQLIALLIPCFSIQVSYAQEEWTLWEADVDNEEESARWQAFGEALGELEVHPININTATKTDLEQLPFLTDRQIEQVLHYVYAYGPLLSKQELAGIEGMDWRSRRWLARCIYIGPAARHEVPLWKKVWKQNKQELITRVDIPFQQKAGYADYPDDLLQKSPNRKYLGPPFATTLRYRFAYDNQVYAGLTAGKDAGEPFFGGINRKGFDAYTGYLYLQELGRLRTLAIGHYRASFGYGLVMNQDGYYGSHTGVAAFTRAGKGLTRHSSVAEDGYLQGVGATWRLSSRWDVSLFYSFRQRDALVDSVWIRSLKTDGLHRLKSDVDKKNAANNHLIGSHLNYNGKYVECGLTAVYTVFNRPLNPVLRPYNVYYPRGRDFLNVGVHYKFFLKRWVLAGETAVDRHGRIAALMRISYSPTVNTTFVVMNRYYDQRYQCLTSNAYAENSSVQNEAGCYVGLETSFLSRFTLSGYADVFRFPFRRYQVDALGTWGSAGKIQLGYSPHRSLSMLIKYAYSDKARNYFPADQPRQVLPYLRHRIHYQCTYSPNESTQLKAVCEYVRAGHLHRPADAGVLAGGVFRQELSRLPLRLTVNGYWFRTDSYDARIYCHEPSVLYAYSLPAFYGKGLRLAANVSYTFRRRWTLQAKYGWTHYRDRDHIGSGTEEIQGSDKTDLLVQLRLKW